MQRNLSRISYLVARISPELANDEIRTTRYALYGVGVTVFCDVGVEGMLPGKTRSSPPHAPTKTTMAANSSSAASNAPPSVRRGSERPELSKCIDQVSILGASPRMATTAVCTGSPVT